jgi:hypothetical protein
MSIVNIYEPRNGHLGSSPIVPTQKVMIIDGESHEIHKVVVHRFITYSEDPDVMIGSDLYEWEHGEIGSWVMQHAIEAPEWSKMHDHSILGVRIVITAKLKAKDAVYFKLKWDSK